MSGFSEILRGINGNLEINRVVGAAGSAMYIVSVPALEVSSKIWGFDFDVTAYSLAYAGGLATLGIGTGAAVAIKDRNVASSKVIEATGSKPATPPAPAPEAKPEIAAATNTDDNAGLPEFLQ